MSQPPRPSSGPLRDFWDKQVSELVAVPDPPELSDSRKERHRLYCYALMAIVAEYWNGNCRGRHGDYGSRRTKQEYPDKGDPRGRYMGGDYLGHNIAALAVDGAGRIIDFDFNHNDMLHRSTEHAEARLVRRVFSLAQIYNTWNVGQNTEAAQPAKKRLDLLPDVTIYTSLESCSQCSGIMALGTLKEVVFIQRDPGQCSIGNILWNLCPWPDFKPPLPIPANLIGLDAFGKLDNAYETFCESQDTEPFFREPDGTEHRSYAFTSFLCTDAALDIYRANAMALAKPVVHPENESVRRHARKFVRYAVTRGMRGSGH